ncbi:flippase [bacterium]|nr:flippase [bacterium]
MEKHKKTLLENFLSLSAWQAVNYIIPLITLPYQSRVLGVEKFGLVYFAIAFTVYFLVLTDFGFDLSATREIAVKRHNKKIISNIFSSVLTIKLLLVILSYIILVITTIFIPKIHDNWLLFHVSFITVIGYALYPGWYFQGLEKMKYVSSINILAKLVFLFSIFIFVKSESDYIMVPLLYSLGYLASGIIGIYFSIKHLGAKFYIPKLKSLKKQFKYSSNFFLSGVSSVLITNTNSFCLGLTGSNIIVGYYVAAEKIYLAMQGLSQPLNNSLYPFVAKNRDIKLYKKIFYIACLLNVLACAIIFLLSKYIITIVYGQQMLPAYNILKIFCVIILFEFPSFLIGYPLIGAMGYTKEVNKSVIYSALFHLTGLCILYFTGNLNLNNVSYLIGFSAAITLLYRLRIIIKYNLWNN